MRVCVCMCMSVCVRACVGVLAHKTWRKAMTSHSIQCCSSGLSYSKFSKISALLYLLYEVTIESTF